MNIQSRPSINLERGSIHRAFSLALTVVSLTIILALIAPAGVASGSPACQPVAAYIQRCGGSSQSSGTVWQVSASNLKPTNRHYGLVDADNIQAAIDLAAPGDTVLLKAGTFVFGKANAADFDIYTADGSFKLYENWLVYWDDYFADPGRYQSININKKGLTLTGEVDATGKPQTFITSPLDFYEDELQQDYWHGYNGAFVINALNVSLANLQIEEFVVPVMAFSPGFDIRNNRFINCGWGYTLVPDVKLTYPNWPDTRGAIKSYFQGNQLINSAQAPVLSGSEMVVKDNYIESYLFGLFLTGFGDPFPLKGDPTQNNLIQGNHIVCTTYSWALLRVGIALWNYQNDFVNNQLIDNTIENCGWGVNSRDYEPSAAWNNTGTVITGNRFINLRRNAINLYSYDDPDGVKGTIVAHNQFVDVGWSGVVPGGVWVEMGVKQSRIFDNDYTLGGQSGWFFDEMGNLVGVGLLGFEPGTESNYVEEYRFPEETTMCDQILDLGANGVVGYGVCNHNPAQALHLQQVFSKSTEVNSTLDPLHR